MSYIQKFKEFVAESARVLRVTKKPTKEEFLTISKVAGIGILIIGLMGFVLYIINELVSILLVSIIVVVAVILLLFIKKSGSQ